MDSAKWKPRVGEKNSIVHKKSNLHDIRAMTGKKTLPGTLAPSIIGDLAKEICRYARYILDMEPKFVQSLSPRITVNTRRLRNSN